MVEGVIEVLHKKGKTLAQPQENSLVYTKQ